MDEIEVVLAHAERATVRVGNVFLKIDSDQARTDREVAAMELAPVPTPEILWRNPPVLALAAVRGVRIGTIGEPSTASAAAWVAAGAMARTLHDAPPPEHEGRSVDVLAAHLAHECEWLAANGVLPVDVISRQRALAETVLRPFAPVFIHGDLHPDHVFVDGDEVTALIDWSEGAKGDALYDLAVLTVSHPEHLDDVLAGYGTDVDRDLIRAWWAYRCLTAVRSLVDQGFGPAETMAEVRILLGIVAP